MIGSNPPLVRLEEVTKTFGRVKANDAVTLDIWPGRVKALLGENGAGKSTLMSILSGLARPDSGRILISGRETRFASPAGAIAAGIGMVYQHFMLIEAMSVAENVLLGQEGSFLLDRKRMAGAVADLAQAYNLKIDPEAPVSSLSMGERQRVEILKLLYRKSQVLIFDEPTAVLTEYEAEGLFFALSTLATAGKAVVFISHKLDEVLAVADEIAILRRGRIEAEFARADVDSKADLARRMIGREVVFDVGRAPLPPGETVLEVANLSGEGLTEVSLDVRQGEIVAVIGVAGNGQNTLVEAVTGLTPASAFTGNVRLLGQDVADFHRRTASTVRTGGMCHIPEDRRELATCAGLNMIDNFLITTRAGFGRGPFLDRRGAAEAAHAGMLEFGVTPPVVDMLAGQFSGGNLQKFVLARELYREPRLIVAEQPTQGLDVAATEDVWRTLLEARKRAGVLLVTGDLTEALSLADRVAVMFRGRIMDMFPTSDARRVENIGLLMAGVSPEEKC